MDMQWNSIKTIEDVTRLNEIFGNFHDCCLKEMCFSTGGFVADNFAMNVIGSPVARFLFQRQINNPTVIELEFKDVIQINIKPVGKNQGVDIISSHLYLQDDIFSGVIEIMNFMRRKKIRVHGLQQDLFGGEKG